MVQLYRTHLITIQSVQSETGLIWVVLDKSGLKMGLDYLNLESYNYAGWARAGLENYGFGLGWA